MTQLRVALAACKVTFEKLLQSGLEVGRFEALLNDAEPSVDELRNIARVLHLPVRELLVGSEYANGAVTKLRTSFGRNVSTELELEGAPGFRRGDRRRVGREGA